MLDAVGGCLSDVESDGLVLGARLGVRLNYHLVDLCRHGGGDRLESSVGGGAQGPGAVLGSIALALWVKGV